MNKDEPYINRTINLNLKNIDNIRGIIYTLLNGRLYLF